MSPSHFVVTRRINASEVCISQHLESFANSKQLFPSLAYVIIYLYTYIYIYIYIYIILLIYSQFGGVLSKSRLNDFLEIRALQQN
jgi:hypothetical protein